MKKSPDRTLSTMDIVNQIKTGLRPIIRNTDLGSVQSSYGRKRSKFSNSISYGFVFRTRTSFLPDSISCEREHKISATIKHRNSNMPVKFCTGSKYIGEWNELGMCNRGVYKFPHGVVYEGQFNLEGEFDGCGILIYPNGQKLEGFWKNGKLVSEPTYAHRRHKIMSNYCTKNDRRFQIERETDFGPAGVEYLVNSVNPPEPLPRYCYEAGEGILNANMRIIINRPHSKTSETLDLETIMDRDRLLSYRSLMETSDESLMNILREINMHKEIESIPTNMKRMWIMKHCRTAEEHHVGYRPDLYEEWTSGASKYVLQLIDEHPAFDFLQRSTDKFSKSSVNFMLSVDFGQRKVVRGHERSTTDSKLEGVKSASSKLLKKDRFSSSEHSSRRESISKLKLCRLLQNWLENQNN